MKRFTLLKSLIIVIILISIAAYMNNLFKNVPLESRNSDEKKFIQNKDNLNTKIEKLTEENTGTITYTKEYLQRENVWNYRNYSQEKIASLSVMGRRLFLHENIGKKVNKTKMIYVYKYGKRLNRRLVRNYDAVDKDPFRNCSVSCQLSYKEIDFKTADAVLFHLHLLPNSSFDIQRQNPGQIWVWMSDESPYNTLMMAKNKDISQFNSMFNWSMTYRSTSDVPVPYGRTVPIIGQDVLPIKNMYRDKRKLVAVLGSNCSGRNHRWKYIRELLKYIKVDVYGGCGSDMPKCPGHFYSDCKHIEGYKFYLSFENSNCLEYVTEKVWWNAFEKESIPVVLGASKKDYLQLLPPNSFIFVEDFKSPEELAKYLLFLSTNEVAFNAYHNWRKKFRILNEHGYFKTQNYHYCRLCEALHYNNKTSKVYESMTNYWNKKRDCYNALWSKNYN